MISGKLFNFSLRGYALGVSISSYLAEFAVPFDLGIPKSTYVSARLSRNAKKPTIQRCMQSGSEDWVRLVCDRWRPIDEAR